MVQPISPRISWLILKAGSLDAPLYPNGLFATKAPQAPLPITATDQLLIPPPMARLSSSDIICKTMLTRATSPASTFIKALPSMALTTQPSTTTWMNTMSASPSLPEFPTGTWAYFTNILPDGVPTYPYNIARYFYGDPSGAAPADIPATAVTQWQGGPEKGTRNLRYRSRRLEWQHHPHLELG